MQILSWLMHVPWRWSLLVLWMREWLCHSWFAVSIWLNALTHAAWVYTIRALVNPVSATDVTAVTIVLLQSCTSWSSCELILDVLTLSWWETVLLPYFLHFNFHFVDVSLNIIFRRAVIRQSSQSFSLKFALLWLLVLWLVHLLVLLILHLHLVLLVLFVFTF